MASSRMLRHVAVVRTDVSEELNTSFIRVTIGELGTTLAVTSNRCMLCEFTTVAKYNMQGLGGELSDQITNEGGISIGTAQLSGPDVKS
jgi:hypothetical protein